MEYDWQHMKRVDGRDVIISPKSAAGCDRANLTTYGYTGPNLTEQDGVATNGDQPGDAEQGYRVWSDGRMERATKDQLVSGSDLKFIAINLGQTAVRCSVGWGCVGSWGFVDVLGLEDEGSVSSVPSPSCALMLLFPLTQQHESFRQQQAGKVSGGTDLYFLKQTVVNSCGTVALLHAVANNPTHIEYDGDSALKKFLDETANMTPAQRATHLENNQAIREAHDGVAAQGQCRVEADNVNFHFITFVNVKGQLYELGECMAESRCPAPSPRCPTLCPAPVCIYTLSVSLCDSVV
ncbi:ubiquitin carboxyl-terminal hydrolase isozyme L1-like [Oncorhynchus tshawytscha]|uniref:ubiquitin carboxyl-terminal hydrolase isozyme L1-like n=1 Tax=Oncorhynchus tshawytscha TaxID=74940 RepID=UPI001C3E1E70|nr:ubiquitin carboxyl-terminal hydrolase isozyme L1-like [Oncorhynchus tshawytscha]